MMTTTTAHVGIVADSPRLERPKRVPPLRLGERVVPVVLALITACAARHRVVGTAAVAAVADVAFSPLPPPGPSIHSSIHVPPSSKGVLDFGRPPPRGSPEAAFEAPPPPAETEPRSHRSAHETSLILLAGAVPPTLCHHVSPRLEAPRERTGRVPVLTERIDRDNLVLHFLTQRPEPCTEHAELPQSLDAPHTDYYVRPSRPGGKPDRAGGEQTCGVERFRGEDLR